MKFNKNMLEKKWVAYTIATCSAVVLYLALVNIGKFFAFLGTVFSYLAPVILGMILAMVLNPIFMFFQRTILKRIKKEVLRKIVSMVLTSIFMLAIMTLLVMAIIPQVINSIVSIASNWASYEETLYILSQDISDYAKMFGLDVSGFTELGGEIVQWIANYIAENIGQIVDFSYSIGVSVFNGVVGFILAVYFLMDKDRLRDSSRRLFKAMMPEKIYTDVHDFTRKCYVILVHYIGSSLLDALIVGATNSIFMLIAGMPYPLLVSVAVAVTNLAPTFGPIVGCAIGSFVLLLVNPWYVLWFVIFTLILQTIDGSVIKPKLYGNTFGVPAVWILIMIIVGGRIFGFWGIMLAIPATAVFAYIFETFISDRIDQKNEMKETKKRIEKY